MTRERRPCACRGAIEADPADPRDVEAAVREHQTELQHRAFVEGEQLAGRYVAPEEIRINVPIGSSRRRTTTGLEIRRVA